MERITALLLIVFFSTGCAPTCQELIESNFRNKTYDLIVLSKDYSTRNVVLYGKNSNGESDTIIDSGIGTIFKIINIGDSIKKKKGKTMIYLIKKDTVIKYPCYCGDTRIE